MAALNASQTVAGANRAFDDASQWYDDLDQFYDYIAPYRKGSNKNARYTDRLSKLYDSTAPISLLRAAGRLQRDLTPPFQTFFNLELGPAADGMDPDEAKAWNEQLERIARTVHAAIDTGNWHASSQEMFLDYLAGQGAMLMLEGDDEQPIRFVAVPVNEIALEDDGFGQVGRVHWRQTRAARVLVDRWPNATWPKDVMDAAKDGRSTREFEITQTTYYDRPAKVWRRMVAVKAGDGVVSVETGSSLTNPWLTPRYFKVPGEPMGRGPGMFVLPDVKVANKTVELLLRAAAVAIVGIWAKTPGPGFNANMSRVAPGAILNVARNGSGNLGPSLSRLETPGSFDISSIILEEFRQRIREGLHDRNLPPDAGPVRSASEVVERLRFYAEDLQVAFGRQTLEIVVPLVKRCIEILYNRGLIKTNLPINQLFVRVRIVSPLAESQAIGEIQRIVDWLTMVSQLLGEEGMILSAKVEEIGGELARLRGVPEKWVRSKADRDTLQELAAAMLAKAQAPEEQQQGTAINGQPGAGA